MDAFFSIQTPPAMPKAAPQPLKPLFRAAVLIAGISRSSQVFTVLY
jgi:hypothetical protein